MRRRWRENPTVEDIRSGLALNALALDLADPEIPWRWRSAPVELPPTVTIESLTFRFADVPKYKLPARIAPAVVALGRMKGDRWPVSLRRAELGRERGGLPAGRRGGRAGLRRGEALRAPQIDAVRDAFSVLEDKAAEVVPVAGASASRRSTTSTGSTRRPGLFLDRDIAEELVRDAGRHKARTVGELLGFMKKYRLVFAEGDEDPAVGRPTGRSTTS